ncbi:MAG TPA: sulfite exporter TauE/SafE family protein [Steroidobacteraceae bacterium]|nr:sulfite exporter TauE/SafE family protein [Steroidobacteraceae bacterium]
MSAAARVLLASLAVLALWYVWSWIRLERARAAATPAGPRRGLLQGAIGFVTNFFDTLGVGSFAPTTSIFKLLRLVPDERIPGTLNTGHALPTVAQALIFIAAVSVDPVTLVAMIGAAVAGAWLGSGVVSKLPRTAIQLGMGAALLVAAILFVLGNVGWIPAGGTAQALDGGWLVFAVACNFLLGALMTLGVGLYAPCLILVSLLGMNPIAAFPIMMGSCAFLMPVAALRFISANRYERHAAVGLALGGIPGVLLAAFVVKSLPLAWLRWLVVLVVLYTAVVMLRAAVVARGTPPSRS